MIFIIFNYIFTYTQKNSNEFVTDSIIKETARFYFSVFFSIKKFQHENIPIALYVFWFHRMASNNKMKRKSQTEADTDEAPSKATKFDPDAPFTQPWKNSDAILVVEDEELHVHSNILSMASPVFEAMFNGNFKEAGTKKVTLDGKNYDLIETMLSFIYPMTDRLGKI